MYISSGLLIFLVAVGFVAVFVLGMSLTLILKGRNIDSEIGTNEHMKAHGIKCAVKQIHEEEHALSPKNPSGECPAGISSDATCGGGDCSTCNTPLK